MSGEAHWVVVMAIGPSDDPDLDMADQTAKVVSV